MPHRLRLSAVAIVILPLLSISRTLAADESLSLIPQPAQVERSPGQFRLSGDTPIVCPKGDRSCGWIANYLSDLIERPTGSRRAHHNHSASGPGAIRFERTAVSAIREGYRLAVTPDSVTISAGTDAGLFYGAVTLWQLASQKPSGPVDIPAVTITDAPRFSWRGLLLDSARHFQSPAFIKSFIDAMALHKLNVLQWHLTDDQGWRLQIRRYPRLTSVGAWRRDAAGRRYGGFYTQAQVRDIVTYARRRNVTIVPEIEMPGHALAAIVSYPKLGSAPHPPRVVSDDWGVFPWLYNVDDQAFAFLKNVLTEVMAMFPGRYIHVGGDEAVKDQWNASPRIADRMQRLHLKDADALQAWFIARIGRFLDAHHRRMIGWDEILSSDLPPDAAVTSWRTIETAVQAAEQGHDVVLAPSPILYFDNCQVRAPSRPCRGTLVTLKDVYGFDPIPPGLPTADQAHVLGVQANLWSEYMDRDDRVARAAFPRAAALADVAWSPAGPHDWPGFVSRLLVQRARYSRLGIPFSDEAFATESSAPPVPPSPERKSFEMEQCTNDLPLALESRDSVVMVNVMNPCWIYRQIDLKDINAFDFDITHFPFKFQIGKDIAKIPLFPEAAAEGQLEVHLDSCTGERLAVQPLSKNTVATLHVKVPPNQGVHDLCFLFARRGVDPVWAIDRVRPVKE
jgi:hexosaminidase